MNHKDQTKASFVTKLSLPKFIAMLKRLTPDQIELVRSKGFGHLLELTCNFLPRGIIHWLASNFDVHSRSFDLPNGFKFTITPFCIHQVLGTPYGGKKIGKKVDAALRTLIAEETNCRGNYPTIAELDDLIKPGLDGAVFKRVFTMYPLTAFLCPSSHGAVSPNYYHVLEDPEEIASFDFSTAILDKIVASIDSYNGGETTVLGGNMLTLACPRLSLWSSEIVAEYERRDCISTKKMLYGRLPTEHVSQTPFSRCTSQDKFPRSSSYDELLQLLLSVTPEGNQKRVMEELPSIIDNMHREMFESMQPIISKSLVSLLKFMPAHQNPNVSKMDARHEVAPNLSGVQHALIAAPFNQDTKLKHDKVSRLDCIKGQQPGLQAGEHGTPPVVNLNFESENLQGISLPGFFMFQEPSREVLARWDEKACGNIAIHYIQDILKSISLVKLTNELDIPYYPDLLEDMNPQKIQAGISDVETPPTLNLLSYMLEDKVFWEQRRQDAWEHHSKSWRTIYQLEEFDIPNSVGCSDASRNRTRPTSSDCKTKQKINLLVPQRDGCELYSS